MEMTNVMQNLGLNLILLGKKGAGKSSSGNTILGREAFISEEHSTSVNHDFAGEDGDVGGLPITVYDTPGFSGTERKKELRKYEEFLQKCELGLCVFLVVLQCDRFTEEDRETVEKIEKLLGEKRMQNTWILFTGEDQLKDENKSIDHLIKEIEALKILNQKYEGRLHSFNNKEKKTRNQVDSLISKVFERNLENLQKKSQQRIPINIQDIPVNNRLSRRIVLLGKAGVGKSSTGNTILGHKEFKSVRNDSVTSECLEKHATVSGRSVSVVDTPGLFDTQMNPEQLVTEIGRCVYLSSPGPHAFLIVFPVNMRFTEQEQQILQMIEMMFGQEVLKYSIILFTYSDLLKDQTIEELINKDNKLRDLVDQCGGRYHVFSNRGGAWGGCGFLCRNNREQVNDLLQMIDTMIAQNGGGHYSNEMYEEAERFRREEEEWRKQQKQRIRAETGTKKREGKKEEQRKEEIEKVMKAEEERIRAEEKSKLESQSGFLKFISKNKSYFKTAAFIVGGIAVGAVGILTGVGAGAGAVVKLVSIGASGFGAVVEAVSIGASHVEGVVKAVSTGASHVEAVVKAVSTGASHVEAVVKAVSTGASHVEAVVKAVSVGKALF